MADNEYLRDLPEFTEFVPLVSGYDQGEFCPPEGSEGLVTEHVFADMWRRGIRSWLMDTLCTVEWGDDRGWGFLLPGVPEDLLPPVWGLAVLRLPIRDRRNGRVSLVNDRRRSLAARIATRLMNLMPYTAYEWIEGCHRHPEWSRMPSLFLRLVAREYPDEVRRCLEAARRVMRDEV